MNFGKHSMNADKKILATSELLNIVDAVLIAGAIIACLFLLHSCSS